MSDVASRRRDTVRHRPHASAFKGVTLALAAGLGLSALAGCRSSDPPATEGRSIDALVTQALDAVGRGDRDTAVELLNQAARLDPTHHVPQQRLCAVHKAAGRYAEALAACERWRALEPQAEYHAEIDGNIEKLRALQAKQTP